MKTTLRILSLISILIIGFTLPAETSAQEKRKGQGPPPWAPAHGYRAKIRHIYFPDYNIYFDVRRGMYIYLSGASWAVAATLPATFKGVNLQGGVQIELELDTDMPQRFNAEHVVKYKGKGSGMKSGKQKNKKKK